MNAPPIRLLYEGLCPDPEYLLDPHFDPLSRSASEIPGDWLVLTVLWAGTLSEVHLPPTGPRANLHKLRVHALHALGQRAPPGLLRRLARSLIRRASDLGLTFHPEAMHAVARDLYERSLP